MYQLRSMFDNSRSAAEYAAGYVKRMAAILENLDLEAVARTSEVMEQACADGKTIFTIGNGGGAAVASALVNDLGPNSLVAGQPSFRILSLTDNVGSVTAIANDSGYEYVFSYQLEAIMRPGDVVIAMSVSGNSSNILRGVEYANRNDAFTIGWTGFDGGQLGKMCHLHVNIPTSPDEYGPVEDMFSILAHIVATYLTMKRGRNLHH
jgi:D-sedoheptulose 7-phosphate isomerase